MDEENDLAVEQARQDEVEEYEAARVAAEQAAAEQAEKEAAKASQDVRRPMVCRMVLFHTTEHDQKIYSQPAVLPAVVTFVNPDGSVNLTIFSDSHDNSYQKNVMQGPAPGQWDWPQY